MSNKRAILAFVVGVLAVLAAMAWVTSHTLRLERAEVEARAEAQRQEVIRLVLWRMDSALTPIIAREAARPYFEYQAFYSAAPTINTSEHAQAVLDVLVPSPLISPSEQYVNLYFQNVPGGELTSPQVPTGVYENLAELSYVTSYSIAAARERLNTLSQLISKHPYPGFSVDASTAVSSRVPLPLSRGESHLGLAVAADQEAQQQDQMDRPEGVVGDAAQSQSIPGSRAGISSDGSARADASGSSGDPNTVPRRSERGISVGKPSGSLGQRPSQSTLAPQASSQDAPTAAVPAVSAPALSQREVPAQTYTNTPGTQQTISEYQARQLATSAANTLTENRTKAPVQSRQQVSATPSQSVESAQMAASVIESTAVGGHLKLKEQEKPVAPAYVTFAKTANSGIIRWQSTWRDVASIAPITPHNFIQKYTLGSMVANAKSQSFQFADYQSGASGADSTTFSRLESSTGVSTDALKASKKTTENLRADVLSSLSGARTTSSPASSSSPQSKSSFAIEPSAALHSHPPRIGTQAPAFTQSPFVARWIEPAPGASPELLFERVVQITPASDSLTSPQIDITEPNTTYVQGIWLDWPGIKSLLLSTSADLLPTAELTPVYDMSVIQGDQSLLGRLLASIPAQLVLPPVPEVALPGWTPIRTTLGVMWAVVLIAICIAAIVLAFSIELAQRRGRFVSAVTHELRTPITTFCMYSQMLADGMVPDGEAKQGYFLTLKGESQRLARIVESVLDYARLSGKKSPVHTTTLSIAQLLTDSIAPLSARCGISEMKLAVNAPAVGDSALQRTITTDRERLDRILFNLIENACKYAADSQSRTVRLEVSILPHALELSVIDDGPGVDPREAQRVFKPFTRGESHVHGSIPGLGLGLAISQGLAQELGGTLSLAPKRSNEGARFILTLPLK